MIYFLSTLEQWLDFDSVLSPGSSTATLRDLEWWEFRAIDTDMYLVGHCFGGFS
jgi:hypothetical protein